VRAVAAAVPVSAVMASVSAGLPNSSSWVVVPNAITLPYGTHRDNGFF
jgi:hypothetical protein